MEEMNTEVIDTQDEIVDEVTDEVLNTENETEDVQVEEASGHSVVEKVIATIVTAGVTYIVYRIGKKVVLKVQGKTEEPKPKKSLQMPFEFKWKGFFKEEPNDPTKVEHQTEVVEDKDNSTKEA